MGGKASHAVPINCVPSRAEHQGTQRPHRMRATAPRSGPSPAPPGSRITENIVPLRRGPLPRSPLEVSRQRTPQEHEADASTPLRAAAPRPTRHRVHDDDSAPAQRPGAESPPSQATVHREFTEPEVPLTGRLHQGTPDDRVLASASQCRVGSRTGGASRYAQEQCVWVSNPPAQRSHDGAWRQHAHAGPHPVAQALATLKGEHDASSAAWWCERFIQPLAKPDGPQRPSPRTSPLEASGRALEVLPASPHSEQAGLPSPPLPMRTHEVKRSHARARTGWRALSTLLEAPSSPRRPGRCFRGTRATQPSARPRLKQETPNRASHGIGMRSAPLVPAASPRPAG